MRTVTIPQAAARTFRGRFIGGVAVALAACAFLVLASGAQAAHEHGPASGLAEWSIFSALSKLNDAGHGEHARPFGTGSLSGSVQNLWGADHLQHLAALSSSSGTVSAPDIPTSPDQVGQWAAPVNWPLVAVNAILQPTGKVLVYDAFEYEPNSERLWDPTTGTFTAVPYGPNLFCSGNVTLSDGRTLIVGGHISSNVGLRDGTVFDPVSQSWTHPANMQNGRWYPTATTLPDGRVIVQSGDNMILGRTGVPEPFIDTSNTLPEIFNPATNTFSALSSAQRYMPLYPFMFVLPDGTVFDAGPDTVTRKLNVATGTWTTVATSPIDGGSAVMYRPGKILKTGTWGDSGVDYPADGQAAVIDTNQFTPAWRSVAPMAFPRSFHNLVVLPDGKVLADGGATRSGGEDPTKAVLSPEMWDPTTETWSTMAAQQKPRLYHSVSVLLPDGRVLSAGGGRFRTAPDQLNAEIYSPPYLFKGARPTISSAPTSVGYGTNFTVNTPDAASIASVALIRPAAMTHAFDMNERFMNLSFTAGSNSLTVTAPADANTAPPGYYMLFILNTNGVPSIAPFMRVSTDPTPPTVSITSPTTGATVSTVTTVTASASDNVSVTGVQFKLDGNNLGAEDQTAPYSVSWDTRTTTNGSHTLTAVARDPSGNITTSAPITVTVDNSSLVAAYGFDENTGTTTADQSGSNNNGTLNGGATWNAAGKFGSAISFNGTNGWVTVPNSASLALSTGMTLEAWVKPSALGTSWRSVVFKEQGTDLVYGLYANRNTTVPNGQVFAGGAAREVNGTAALPLNAWSHIATTYDGATLRLYLNGTQVGSLAQTGNILTSNGVLRIGGNNIWPEWFQGLIDEVRIYNRALSATEIQADMNTSISQPDTTPPSAPGTLTATGGLGQVSLSWGAATDNVGVHHYNVHRSTTQGFTPDSTTLIAQPTGLSYLDAGQPTGTYYYKVTAADAAGNVGPLSNEASATVTADTTPPSAPGTLTATGGAGQATLSWGAATDNVGVHHYNLHRSTTPGFTPNAGNRIAQPTGLTYTDMNLAAGTYYYKVTAEDAAGNVGPVSNEASAVVTTPPIVGLVGAWGFDENSGTTTADASGNNNNATLTNGPVWSAAGKFGSAISFDGVNDYVNVPDANSLDLTNGMTLEAWVKPSALTVWRTVMMKEQPGNTVYDLYASRSGTNVPTGEIFAGGGVRNTDGTAALALNTWTHLALTYNGQALTLYVNGTQVSQALFVGSITTSTGALKIGGDSVFGEWFQGLIDEVRIYNRALNQTEIQTDMNRPITNPDSTPPSAPGTLTATGGLGQVSLSWGAATDNVGVHHYNVHRSTTPGFTPNAGNRIAQPTGLTYTDAGQPAGTYYYKVTAEDAAGNVGPPSNEASAAVTADTTPPSAPGTLTATGGAGSAALNWGAATDNVGVHHYNVHRSTTPGFTPNAGNRIAQPSGLSYTDSGLAPGTYYYRVTAEDAAGNVGPPSNEASATITNPPPPTGLVAAYGFDENTGTTTADQSGNNNNGTLNGGAAWNAAGKFGAAISFNGTNGWVTVPDSNSLDLTTGMTLEAWVKPSALGTNWRSIIFKEQGGDLVYGLYGNRNTTVPNAQVYTGGSARELNGTAALALNTWTHLAATYDGATMRLYVNGVQAASLAQTGSILTSTGVLRIGGNNIWPEWFQGLIDEVRIYNRALSASEIQTDMTTSISVPDTVPPSAPGTLTASGGLGQAILNWGAATDNVGVHHYNVYRSTTSGFTPNAGNRIAQPTGLTYTDAGQPAGTYYYKVTAEDAAGNVGPSSNEASAAVTSDTTPPSAPGTLTANGSAGQAALSWGAATDNVGVHHYNLHRSTTPGFTASAANRIAQPTGLSYTDTGLAAGTYYYKVTAEDAAGNVGPTSNEASATVINPPPVGLVAAYGFDENTGTTTADVSGNGNTGTLNSGATWASIGKFGSAISFNGTNGWVTVPDANSLDLTTGMTLEAWVKPTALGTSWRSVIFKEQTGDLVYGMYANRNTTVPNGQIYTGGTAREVNGSSALGLNTWTHLAVTYDGTAIRLYVNGALAATTAQAGNITTSTGVLRIGGNNIWPEWFQGLIDEVRIYNRPLSATEIGLDMNRGAGNDTTPPTVASVGPTNGATNVPIDRQVTAQFSEAMDPATIDGTSFELRDASNALVPATVTYNSSTGIATLAPTSALVYGTTYTAKVHGGTTGPRVKDLAGNALAADYTWTFSIEPAPPPVLVITSSTNPFSTYVAEMLRAEGLDDFATLDVSLISPTILSFYDVAILGNISVTASQVTTLTNWVNSGGNLIAMRPDSQLSSLLGITSASGTLSNAYMLTNTSSGPGVGIVNQTIQFHGTADLYTLNGATSVGTLYTTATNATTNPAVTLRSVGSNGGQAAAFTYDLARSVMLTRQGNPAWAGQERDGVVPVRPDDLFFGAKTGDVQPDWVDTSKMAIPQADEQQRLLVNMIETMNKDRKPIPRFWYLPRGNKAAIVMSGDDHANGGTAGRFDMYKAASPVGCSVANWECVRSTSYIYPSSPLTNAQAASYTTDGFEVALHPQTGIPCANWTPASLRSDYSSQLSAWRAKYTSIPVPTTNRTHCVAWDDWLTMAQVELENGVRFDTNYYHYPASWIGNIPGFMTGSGEIMRFADTDGTLLDVYQANTEMTDESGQAYPATVNSLLDKALGPEGYYGAFVANIHTDFAASPESDAIVASAQARAVPIVSAKQMLDWTDGRNNSTFRSFSWSSNTLGFTIAAGSGANGLQAMLPTHVDAGTLSSITRGGNPVPYTIQTIKGVEYAFFTATAGTYAAVYGP